jgi:hypothetical protein
MLQETSKVTAASLRRAPRKIIRAQTLNNQTLIVGLVYRKKIRAIKMEEVKESRKREDF